MLRDLPKGSVGAEIGVWKGDFSARILKIVRPATLHLIDPWQHMPENQSAWWGGNSGRNQLGLDSIYDEVRGRFAGPISSGQVVLHRTTSAGAIDAFSDASLDWLYLDGDHLFDAVSTDLRGWWPKVKPGGRIVGDDFDMPNSRWKDGVTLAVRQFAKEQTLTVRSVGRHQFVLPKGP